MKESEQPAEPSPTHTLQERIINHVYDDSYRPTKPRNISRALKVSEDDYPGFRRTIKSLVQSGQLTYASNHLILKPGQQSKSVSVVSRKSIQGTFRATNSGYGFVTLKVTDEAVGDDVFIPPRATSTAMDGDLVAIRITKSEQGGRREGIVEEVVQRARRDFVGTFQLLKGRAVVWIDGVQSESPVEVGDVRGLPVNENDKIIVEMVRYPDAFHPGEAVILRVLGANSNPAVDTIAVMHQFGLDEEFPENVLSLARDLADTFNNLTESPDPNDSASIFFRRRDLTAVPTCTIDPFDARDFDDAISLSRNEVGNWELQVHIADVSHFVPEGTPLDEESQRRATSVYLPDKVIPMLPEIISNHLASLQPDRLRLAKTVKLELSDTGLVLHTEIFNSVIKNAYRFNYEQIDQYLENDEPWREKLPAEIFQIVREMHSLAMILRSRRIGGGSIELTLPEVKIDLDKQGKVKGAHLVHHTESHQLIEEFMLAANQAVATYLDDRKIPLLRRAHAPPQRVKLRRLYEFVTGLGIECGDLQDRFEIQRIVSLVKNQPLEQAVNFSILKSMSKAVYQPQPERHYALDMTHYCHFTSPIRRYPDLVVHRIIQRTIDNENAVLPLSVLGYLGQHCSDREVNAENAERELIRVKLLHFMSKRIHQEFVGVIASVKADGVDVRLKEIPVDGKVPIELLPKDRYRFDRQTHVLEGFRQGNRFRLGDVLQVRVEQVDLARRELLFSLVEKLESAPSLAKLPQKIRGSHGKDMRGNAKQSSNSKDRVESHRPADDAGLRQFDRKYSKRSKPSSTAPVNLHKKSKKKSSRPGKTERKMRKNRPQGD